MTKPDNGGPAFPTSVFHDESPLEDSFVETKGGMSLRDYFAGQAMTAIGRTYLGSEENPAADLLGKPTFAEEARRCYAWADAMLIERKKEIA